MAQGPTPLSVGQFQADGAQAGAPAAAGGVSSLASAFIGQPQALAQARYLGAETGRAQAQTGALTSLQNAKAQVSALLTPDPANPTASGINDPSKVQQAAALVAGNPDLAAAFPGTLATMMQAAVATHAPERAECRGRRPVQCWDGRRGRGQHLHGTGPGPGQPHASCGYRRRGHARRGTH